MRDTKITRPAGWVSKGSSLAILALAALIPAVQGSTSFTDGTFDQTCTGTQTTCTGGDGQLGYNTNTTGWTNDTVGTAYGPSRNTTTSYGYNFLFSSTSDATSGEDGVDGSLALYNGDTSSPPSTYTLTGASNGGGVTGGAIPGGGNFIAADGAYNAAGITQTITGLTPGAEYVVGFWWAAAQQTTFTGATSEQWQVSLGGSTQSTPVVDNPSEGFSGWMYETLEFAATSGSEALTFLSVGTPISPSEPPFALLADVTFTDPTPEPGTLSLLLGGFGLIGLGALRSRRRKKN